MGKQFNSNYILLIKNIILIFFLKKKRCSHLKKQFKLNFSIDRTS